MWEDLLCPETLPVNYLKLCIHTAFNFLNFPPNTQIAISCSYCTSSTQDKSRFKIKHANITVLY